VGLLANITSPRTAIAIAGLLILTTPLLLPGRDHTQHEHEPTPGAGSATAGAVPDAQMRSPSGSEHRASRT
jgi:hypothetical protein